MLTHKLTFDKILLELINSMQIFFFKYSLGFGVIHPPFKTLHDIFHLCGIDIVCQYFWGDSLKTATVQRYWSKRLECREILS